MIKILEYDFPIITLCKSYMHVKDKYLKEKGFGIVIRIYMNKAKRNIFGHARKCTYSFLLYHSVKRSYSFKISGIKPDTTYGKHSLFLLLHNRSGRNIF